MFLRDNEVGGKVAAHVRRGDRVLDFGAGTGLISRWLVRHMGVEATLTDLIEYSNRRRDLPFIRMSDPFHVPAEDRSFDVVLLLFVLHHNRYEEQGKVLAEAARLAGRRLIVIEDTPTNRIDRALNMGWDKILNLRHATPTPYTYRTAAEWEPVFMEQGLSVVHAETYRAKWPTLWTYHHTLFVLDRDAPDAAEPE